MSKKLSLFQPSSSKIRNQSDASLLRFSKKVRRCKIIEITLWLHKPYVSDALRYVTEESITLRRSMLCSHSIFLASWLSFRYFINACSVQKKIVKKVKEVTHFQVAMLTTQSPNGLYYLSFLVKLFDSIEVYLPGKLKAYLV